MKHDELQGATILIVDDQPENLGVLFDYFQEFGCTVLVSESGEYALDIAEENRPDIILLDILMPGIGGFETCRRLKASEDTREIPVLFISSLSETVDKVHAFELGGVDFITKPFQVEEVLARVSAHLGYHILKQELEQKNLRLEEEILQHKLTERALQKARDEADSANRAKSVFLSNMSHELRTPLNGVLGYAQILLKEKNLLQHQKEALTTILNQGEHLLALIDEILEFSKLESQKIELAPTHFRLPEFLYSVADTIRMLAFRKGLQFSVDIAQDLPLIVYGDHARIRQILLNLLSNAVKFTEQGSIEFSAVAKRWPHTPEDQVQEVSLHFKIKDSGIGIPGHLLPEIFNAFKTSGSQYTQTEGAGLGLAVSQHFARMMNGDIFVESVEGQGAIFYIDLDVLESPPKEVPQYIEDGADVLQYYSGMQNQDEPPSESQLIFPSADELDVLYQAAIIGDIMAVREWSQQRRAGDERLLPFVEKIERWAQSFDIGNLQKFLQNIVETEHS